MVVELLDARECRNYDRAHSPRLILGGRRVRRIARSEWSNSCCVEE